MPMRSCFWYLTNPNTSPVKLFMSVAEWKDSEMLQTMGVHMENKTNKDLIFYAAGDVAPYREDPASIFQHVKEY